MPRPFQFLQGAGVRNIDMEEYTDEAAERRSSFDSVDSRPCKKRKDGAPGIVQVVTTLQCASATARTGVLLAPSCSGAGIFVRAVIDERPF